MGLKNYVVIAENVSIERQSNMIDYLFNEKHSNHKNTKIIAETTKDSYITHLTKLKHKNELNYISNAKGGKKLKRIAKSLTFNPPKDYNLTEQQIKDIVKELKRLLSEEFKAKEIELTETDLLFVAHIQKNSHIHALIPTLDKNGRNIREINAKSFITSLKVLFTQSVDKILSKNIEDYKIEANNKEDRIINDLERLKADYETLMQKVTDKSKKYLSNQVKIIDRYKMHIQENKVINQLQIEKLNTNIEKVNKATKSNINTIKF